MTNSNSYVFLNNCDGKVLQNIQVTILLWKNTSSKNVSLNKDVI